jgi:hypothetical protein
MGSKRIHYRVHDLLRVRELRLGVVAGLNDQLSAFQQLPVWSKIETDEKTVSCPFPA